MPSIVQLIFISIKVMMYLLLYVGGNAMARSRNGSQYWHYAIIPIIAYTFSSGLRFGRDIDYNLYYFEYNDIVLGKTDFFEFEPIFTITTLFLGKLCGLEWQYMVIFMSFFLIFSCVVFLERYKEVSALALPLFVFNMRLAENTMRWFFAFSFLLIALSFFRNPKYTIKKSYYSFVFFSFLAVMTHYFMSFVIIIYLLLMISKKCLFGPKLSLCIFAISIFFSSPLMFGGFIDDVARLEFLTGRFEHYATNAEMYITGEGTEGYDGLDYSSYIYSIFMIIVGYKIVQMEPSLVLPYNIALVGIFTAPLFSKLEIGMRMRYVLFSFQFIILAFSFMYIFTNKMKSILLLKVICILLLLNMARSQIAIPLSQPDSHLLYVWDRNGQKYLDVDSYYK